MIQDTALRYKTTLKNSLSFTLVLRREMMNRPPQSYTRPPPEPHQTPTRATPELHLSTQRRLGWSTALDCWSILRLRFFPFAVAWKACWAVIRTLNTGCDTLTGQNDLELSGNHKHAAVLHQSAPKQFVFFVFFQVSLA